MELFLVSLFGLVIGIAVGLLPGLGPGSLMLILFPFFAKLSLLELFVFYFSMLTSTQYYGSVSAIVYGVPGEISSVPAVKYGHPMYRNGEGTHALMQTATGSLIGALFGIVLLAIAMHYANYAHFFFKNSVKTVMLLTAFGIMIMLTPNRLLAAIMVVCGLFVGKIGYDNMLNTRLFTMGFSNLDAGIPFYPLFMGFIVIPQLWSYYKNPSLHDIEVNSVNLANRLQYLKSMKYKWSILRGSIIGFVVGLIPGASYTISSNLAVSIENRVTTSDAAKLVSAETANNAGSISVLLPLLLFAIPIVPSEALLLSVAQTKGFTPSVGLFTKYYWTIIIGLVVINIVNWILSGALVSYVLRIQNYVKSVIYPIVGLISIAIMAYIAYDDNQMILSAVVFGLSLSAAKFVKSDDTRFLFIFAFFMSDFLLDEVYRFYQLNF